MRLIIIGLSLLSSWSLGENLYQIYSDAVKNDYVMQAAGAQLRVKEENQTQSQAQYLPQIGLDSSYSKKRDEQKRSGIIDVDTSGLDPNDPFEEFLIQTAAAQAPHIRTDTTHSLWNVVLTQEVFNMPYWYGMRSTKHLTLAAEYEFFKAQQDLIVRTVEAYLSVLRAQNNLSSSLAAEKAYQQQLDQTTQRFKVGLVAHTDVQEAQAAYDLAKVQRISDEGALAVSFESLTVLTGKQYNEIDGLAKNFPIKMPSPSSREEWVTLANEKNPDLNIQRETTEAAKLSAKSLATSRLPTIAFNANYGRGHMDTTIDSNLHNNGIAVTMRMPLFTSGSVSSKIRQEYARLDLAKDNLGATERTVNQQIRSAHIQTQTSIHSVEAQRQAVVSSKSALEAVKAGYEYGTRNILDVLQSQQKMYAAMRDYGNSRYDYILSILQLKQIGGSLTPEDIATSMSGSCHPILYASLKTTNHAVSVPQGFCHSQNPHLLCT
ncbi:MAG: TolC family outer membrane protein [Cellvibrionales bacterium]|nr:TolC family outer membrane protein [Cellvibrionales bacterium]